VPSAHAPCGIRPGGNRLVDDVAVGDEDALFPVDDVALLDKGWIVVPGEQDQARAVVQAQGSEPVEFLDGPLSIAGDMEFGGVAVDDEDARFADQRFEFLCGEDHSFTTEVQVADDDDGLGGWHWRRARAWSMNEESFWTSYRHLGASC